MWLSGEYIHLDPAPFPSGETSHQNNKKPKQPRLPERKTRSPDEIYLVILISSGHISHSHHGNPFYYYWPILLETPPERIRRLT